jgi:hypothetical protein
MAKIVGSYHETPISNKKQVTETCNNSDESQGTYAYFLKANPKRLYTA